MRTLDDDLDLVETDYEHVPELERTHFYLAHELSRRADEIRYVANWSNAYVGTGTSILCIRVGPLRPDDRVEGTCKLGPIVQQREYFEGADVLAVRDRGFRLSWPTACWLYEAARETLIAIHHPDGAIHGRLRPERIRFGLMNRDNDGDPFDVASPFYFPNGGWTASLGGRNVPGTDAERAAELSTLAYTIAQLTTHPDPAIDRLLHDRDARDVLRDLLIQRDERTDLLLHDRAMQPILEVGDLPDAASIDDELTALWRIVIELEPMLDHTPELFALPRLGDKPYPGA